MGSPSSSRTTANQYRSQKNMMPAKATARHRYWHVLGLLVFTGALTFVLPFGVRSIPFGSTSGLESVTVGVAVETILASVSALTLAILYFDLHAAPRSACARRGPFSSRRPGTLRAAISKNLRRT